MSRTNDEYNSGGSKVGKENSTTASRVKKFVEVHTKRKTASTTTQLQSTKSKRLKRFPHRHTTTGEDSEAK